MTAQRLIRTASSLFPSTKTASSQVTNSSSTEHMTDVQGTNVSDKMCEAISNPENCEVRAVIRFLLAKKHSAAEIHRQLSEVYGSSVMSAGKVRQWCRLFRDGRTNVHNDERTGRPSVMSTDLVEKVNSKILENRRITISQLSMEFPAVSRSVIYDIVTEKLEYKNVCAKWMKKCKPKRKPTSNNFNDGGTSQKTIVEIKEIVDAILKKNA